MSPNGCDVAAKNLLLRLYPSFQISGPETLNQTEHGVTLNLKSSAKKIWAAQVGQADDGSLAFRILIDLRPHGCVSV